MSITIETLTLSQVEGVQAYLHPSAQTYLTAESAPVLLAARVDGAVCGGLVATVDGDECTIHSLFVDERYRRQGIGTQLVDTLLQGLSPQVEEVYIQWVLPQEDCQGMEDFFQRQGFDCTREDIPIFRIYSGDLAKSPMLRSAFSPRFVPDANIIPVSQWSQEIWDDLRQDTTIDPLLRPEPFRDSMWSEVSAGYYYGGKLVAYLLLKQGGPREIVLLPAVARKGAHPAAILQLLAAALNRCRQHYQADFAIWTHTITPHSRMLVERLAVGKAVPWWNGEGTLERKGEKVR